MDSQRETDSVKVEKLKAMVRYRRVRNVAMLLRAVEVFVAVAFVSWSSTRFPAVVSISGEYLFKLSACLLSPYFVFLVGNAIVVGLYLVSLRNDGDGGNDRGGADIYDEYVQHSQTRPREANPAADETPSPSSPQKNPEPELDASKQIVPSVSADVKSKCDAVEAAIRQATREIKRFQRTHSEKLKRELRVKPRAELRRSVSETYRTTTPSGDEHALASSETVEDLSNEEFRRTIDSFIEQQRVLFAQKMSDKSTSISM